MKTTFKLELDEHQYAKLLVVANERGLAPDEMIRLLVMFNLNYRYRDLQVENARVGLVTGLIA